MHFGIFLSLSQKVFAEITVRNNLDFGYTAGAVNGADAYEKNAFQQKCYVNFLWLSRFLFLPEHNAMQEEASPGNFLITTAARLFAGAFMMSSRQIGICITVYLLKGVHKSIHPPSFQSCLSFGFFEFLPFSFPVFS